MTQTRKYNYLFHFFLLLNLAGMSQEKGADFQMDISSDYIWRDLVYGFPVIQPSVSKAFDSTNFSLNAWTSIGARVQTNDIEMSLTANYDIALNGKSYLSTGVVHYVAAINTELVGPAGRNTNTSEVFLLYTHEKSKDEKVVRTHIFSSYYDVRSILYTSFEGSYRLAEIGKNDSPLVMTYQVGSRLVKLNWFERSLRHFTLSPSLELHQAKYFDLTIFCQYIFLAQQAQGHRGGLGISIFFK